MSPPQRPASLPHRPVVVLGLVLGLGLFLSTNAAAEGLSLQGFAAVRGSWTEGQPSWLEGGFGHLPFGAETVDDNDVSALGKLHLVLGWENSAETFGVHLHTAAREEPSAHLGSDIGLVEAFVHGGLELRRADILRYKVGLFILPTSRENVEAAWASPYTLSFSALNAWIGEEVRLTGALLEHTFAVGTIDGLRLGASVFGGNDTAGTLLAWRGWVPGDRLTLGGEVLPLPPLRGLQPGGGFEAQLDRGTQPFTDDLDGRAGWAAYARWQRPQTAVVQLTHYDNRADRALHDGPGYQYAWRTQFDLLGVEVHPHPEVVLLGEHLQGKTGMGDRTTTAFVDADIEATYLLASWRPGRFRLSARWESFETLNRDTSRAYDLNDGNGEAFTLSLFWDVRRDLRLGFEALHLDADRPVASTVGFDPDTGGDMITFEVRYYLGF